MNTNIQNLEMSCFSYSRINEICASQKNYGAQKTRPAETSRGVLNPFNYFSEVTEAPRYSLFILAIFSKLIPFGHSTSQAPVLVQFPKPSASI